MKHQNTYERICKALSAKPSMRDDIHELVTEIHAGYIALNIGWMDYNRMLSQRQLPSIETIARLSRKAQLEHQHLRGKKYFERLGMQLEVQHDLGYNV